jgi:hypothetical protein
MKFRIITALFTIIAFVACSDKDEKTSLNKTEYEQQKESLLDKEKKNAKKFLQLTGDDKRNIWGKTVYKGVIKNIATVCSYKNIRVKLLYYKEGSLVTNHEELFEETLAPGNEFEFKAKYKTPKGTDSVFASIMSATPNN